LDPIHSPHSIDCQFGGHLRMEWVITNGFFYFGLFKNTTEVDRGLKNDFSFSEMTMILDCVTCIYILSNLRSYLIYRVIKSRVVVQN